MSTLLNGRVGLGADMAIRFEKAFGLSADCVSACNFDPLSGGIGVQN
jgi:plasmid maintenance system antidote protein VapI